MKLKSLIATAVLAASSISSFAATTAITLTNTATNVYAADFSAFAGTNTYTVDFSALTGLTNFSGIVTANTRGFIGYNVTNVTFDGLSFNPTVNTSSANASRTNDLWELDLSNVTSTSHTMVITGTANGGSTAGFSGSLEITNTPLTPLVQVTAVPEPESYAMLLAGLGLMGAIARRRNKSKAG